MSKAIKCDRCGNLDDGDNCSQLCRSCLNFGDAFRKEWYPDVVDLCEACTEELLAFIKGWAKKEKP